MFDVIRSLMRASEVLNSALVMLITSKAGASLLDGHLDGCPLLHVQANALLKSGERVLDHRLHVLAARGDHG